MNRITQLFENKKNILNIYYTAGYPGLDDTIRIASSLENAGVDMLEIGIPFSDPVADGPTIQQSSTQALANGMTVKLLFDQLKELRKEVKIPVLLMGYINPIFQFGIERFCKCCEEVGIDGLIIPDLPLKEYEEDYKSIFDASGLANIFLISPNTAVERIHEIDEISSGFIYMVSSASITGAKKNVQQGQIEYYQRIAVMNLKSPRLIGFGISNRETFDQACQHAEGAIIGSAFIDLLRKDSSDQAIKKFVQSIKN